MSNDFYDNIGPVEYEPGLYDRWRPALFAIAVLLTVVAIAVMRNSSSNESTNGSNPDVVVDSSGVPRETVTLTRTLRKGMKGDDVLRL
ncbi:MAG: hypothetical protein ACO3D9_03745, partial [Ilumatobacteraceae bacterium]